MGPRFYLLTQAEFNFFTGFNPIHRIQIHTNRVILQQLPFSYYHSPQLMQPPQSLSLKFQVNSKLERPKMKTKKYGFLILLLFFHLQIHFSSGRDSFFVNSPLRFFFLLNFVTNCYLH
jgi:hypothetical protein